MSWNVEIPKAEWYTHDSPGLEAVIREVIDQKNVALDTETTGLSTWKDTPLFWSLAWGERRMCMPTETLHYFKEAFAQEDKNWIFANAKFDAHMLANYGIDIEGNLVDTQVMHSLLYEERPHGLKSMAMEMLGWRWSDFDDTFKRKPGETIQDIIMKCYHEDRKLLVEYAANDAYGTLKVFDKLDVELSKEPTFSLYPQFYETMGDLFWKTEVPFTKTLYGCERWGALLDLEYLDTIRQPVMRRIEEVEKEANRVRGRNFNLSSGQDLAEYFFDIKKFRPLKLTKGGASGIRKPSIDSDFLEMYQQDPIAALALEKRDLTKLLSTYVEGLADKVDYNNRIHTRYGQSNVRTGRLSSSDPNCFHPDTELLTPAGWVKISEYKNGPVAQWEEGGNVSFVDPTAYIKKTADKLVHLNNQHIRLAVTEDHRCLLRHRKTGALKVFSGKDYPEDWQQIQAGHYRGGHITMDEALLRLVVATQADGHIQDGAINFAFKKSRKSERLLTLLDQLGAPYTHNPGDSLGRVRIRLPKSDITLKVRALLGERKLFDSWILELSEESLHVFCEEIFFWDGSWTRKNNYASKEIENTTWVQTALSMIGKRAHMRTYVSQGGSVSYQVDVVDRDFSLTTNISKVTAEYRGDVYCVSVPSTYVVVRYDNHVHVTGQCQNIPNPEKDRFQIRKAFIARPGYKLLCLDYEALEMRLLGAAALEPNMIKIFESGRDIHMGNAALVYGVPYDDIKAAKKKDKKDLTDYDRKMLAYRASVKVVGFG